MSTEPCDLDFCRALPKIELHAHLHGSLRQSSIAELSGKPFPALSDSRDLTECFRIFDLIHHTVDSLSKVERLTREVLEDFKADNCIYLELRSTPRDRLNSWSKRQYLDCVTAALLHWNQHEQMPVRLLLSIDRTTSLEEALSVVDLAEEYRGLTNGLIVGLDFCGNPTKSSFAAYEAAFRIGREKGLKCTIHTAEVLDEHDTQTILAFRPDRLGHCCCLSESHLQRLCHQDRIPVELCLTSNMHTAKDRYPTAELHVFGEFHAAKLPLCICTDDTGVFANCLSSEYVQIAAAFQLSRPQMFDIAEQAVHLTFDEQVRPGLLEQFRQAQCTLRL